MKVLELEDGELAFLVEACNVVNVPGKVARGLVALQEKLAKAAATEKVPAAPAHKEE